MAKPSDNIDVAARAWSQRLASIQGAGMDPNPALAVAKYDMQRVMQGGTPRSDLEVLNEVRDAYTGTSAINKHPGGGITDFLGNIGGDLQHMVQDFLPGTVHTVENLLKPSSYGELASAVSNFDMSPHHDAQLLEKTKLGGLIPGVWTLSSSWHDKFQHPLMSLLDVLPYASEASKLATPAIADAAKIADSPALTALSEGHLGKAALNTKFLPGDILSPRTSIMDRIANMTRDTEFAPGNMQQWAFYNQLKRRVSSDSSHLLTKMVDDGVMPAELTDAQRAQLADAAISGKPVQDPAQQTQLDNIRQWINDNVIGPRTTNDPRVLGPTRSKYTSKGHKTETGYDFVRVPREHGGYEVYPINSRVAKAYKAVLDARDTVIGRSKTLREAEQSLKDAQNRWIRDGAKLRRFGETTEQFKARGPEIVDTNTAAQAVSGLAQFNLGKDYDTLVQSLIDGRPIAAKRAVDRLLSRQDLPPEVHQYLRYFKDQVTGLKSRGTKSAAARDALNRAQGRAVEAKNKVNAANKAAFNREHAYYNVLKENPSARWHPLLRQLTIQKIEDISQKDIQQVQQMTRGEALVDVVHKWNQRLPELQAKLKAATGRDDIAEIVGKDALDTVVREVTTNWQDLIKDGYDPIWVQNTNADAYGYGNVNISPLPDNAFKPEFTRDFTRTKEKLFNFAPQELDVAASLTKFALEDIRERATNDLIQHLLDTGAVRTYDSIAKDLTSAFQNSTRPGADVSAMVNREINKHYSPFAPHDYLAPGKARGTTNTAYLIPKGLERGFQRLLDTDNKLPIHGIYNRTMNTFKLAVLTGPRHLVHVALGGMTMMMFREPEALTQFGRALEFMRNPELGPKAFRDNLLQGVYHESPDLLYQEAAGKTMGRMLKESFLKRGIENLTKFEGTISDMYRVMVGFSELEKTGNVDMAVALAHKVFVDLDNMTPFERSVVRQVMPFWAFTKHTLRYVLTYPADHPWRAAILAKMVDQLLADHKSGEPERLMQLFFLGTPDSKGNVPAVDMRNLNPFRSMASAFSMQGFFQGLNPLAQEGFRALGVDPLSASPELYPTLTIDQFSGAQVAKRPGISMQDFAESIVPELQTLDHYIQFTDRMRQMKKYSPEAYRRDLFSALNLPFSIAPVNIPQVRARFAANEFKVAQDAVSAAMRSGNTDELRKYDNVPFRGQIVPSNVLADFIDSLNAKTSKQGIAPSAILPKTTTKRRKKA